MSRNSKKGFTMIELLGAIVILGVISVLAIVSINRVIEKARSEQDAEHENTLKEAAISYMQANPDKLPKSIGEKVNVTANTLYQKHYLKSKIKNTKGEDCMPNSFVRVYKTSKTKYEYTPLVLCGSEEYDEDSVVTPTIDLYFSDDTGDKNFDVFNHVNQAMLYMTLTGGKEEDGTKVAIDGYSYTISVKTKDDANMREAYNSGTLSGNNLPEIVVQRKITDYIDVADITDFNVKVTVINKLGGVKEITTDASQGTYHDTEKPKCVAINGQAENENDWINKSQSATRRTITATCEDAKGSGCLRPTFSRTWPNEDQTDAEWAYIQVTDNAGNHNLELEDSEISANSLCNVEATPDTCRVRVNVDKKLPTIKILGAYKASSAGDKANTTNTYTGSLVVNDSSVNGTGTINDTEYNNLVATWMNKANYPYGVVYEIEISDNIHLDSWTWKTNESYLTIDNNTAYNTYSGTGDGAKSGTVSSSGNGNCGTLTKTILVGFKEEGRRKGILTVKDKAGNKTTVTIEANLDRTSPPVPSGITYSNSYVPGTTGWINKTVTATVPDNMQRDNTSGPNKVSLSGWKKFNYHVTKDYDTANEINGSDNKFTFNSTYQGKNNVEFNSCDNANNCSDYSGLKPIWVDFTSPICNITVTATGRNSAGWLGIGEKAIVKAECQETESNKESGCTTPLSFSHTYNENIITENAGALGVEKGGTVYDVAGNKKDCSYKNIVKIDHNAPTCITLGESTTWRKEGTTITRECRDTGGSNCVKKVYASKVFATEGKTYKTEDFAAYEISDVADNKVTCPKITANIYVDKQKPSCSGSKSNQNTTAGVTIKYTCGDHGGSGVANCPGKQTKVKSTQSHTVKDNVGNKMTCTVSVSSYNQYRYIKKNVANTCANSCTGCQTYNSRKNCDKCGYAESYHWTKWAYSQPGCGKCKYYSSEWKWGPSQYGNSGASKMYRTHCYCKTCNTCQHKDFGCKKYKSKTSGECCGYRCGSQWTDWGASSTGCKSDSRKLYK